MARFVVFKHEGGRAVAVNADHVMTVWTLPDKEQTHSSLRFDVDDVLHVEGSIAEVVQKLNGNEK